MWWCRRVVVLGLATAVGGCGFRPLYGRDQGGESVLAALAAVDVAEVRAAPADRRIAQVLRGAIGDGLDPHNLGAARRFRLEIALTRRVEALAISTDDVVTRYNVRLGSEIRLVDLADGSVAYSTRVRSVGSYDVQQSDFGTVIAEESTSADAARDLAARIVTLLAAYFERGGG
jgi:LPS-assembly lipoprotein